MATPPRSRRRAGFTLVEVLVVLGILVVLVSFLLPTISRLREAARETECRGHLRQLMTGFFAFAADHDGVLPGGFYDINDPDPTRRCWLMGGVADWRKAPETGTIFPYINDPGACRCPTLTEAPGSGVRGKTSNGRFDYSMFLSLAGARLSSVSKSGRYRRPDGQFTFLPTPVLCEENTDHLNTVNLEGGHASSDRMGRQHRGGGHYASIDGSVHWFVEDPLSDTRSWFSQAPSGNWVFLGADQRWGWWNKQ